MASKLGPDFGKLRAAAGKDTQTRRLVRRYGWPTIITSVDLVVPTANGELCPDSLVCARLSEHLANITVEQTFILNGMPRTDAQVDCLAEILQRRYGQDWRDRTKVVDFGVCLETGWERLEAASDRGDRADDDYDTYCKRHRGHVLRGPQLAKAFAALEIAVEKIDTDFYTADGVYWELTRRLNLERGVMPQQQKRASA